MTSKTLSWQQIVEERGLDVSVVETLKLGSNLRIDAEFNTANTFYDNPKFINAKIIIKESDYGTSKELNEERRGYPTLRLNEFESDFIGKPQKFCDKISKDIYEKLLIKKGDVLICRTNGNPRYVGKSAIAIKDSEYIFASYLFRIRTNEKVLPEMLVVYLNGKYGRSEIEKYSMVSNQANFSPAKFREILIPIPKLSFQKIISELVTEAHEGREKSKKLYAEAEKILLNELGLNNWQLSEKNIAVKSSEEMNLYGRADAEFFQPKYDEIEAKIKSYSEGWDSLENLIEVQDDLMKIQKDKKYQYCELADIDLNLGVVNGYNEIIGADLPSRARMKIEKNDVVVSSVAGSSGKVALIQSEDTNLVASTGFFVLRSKEFLPEINLLLLKSFPYQEFLKRSARGMILSATIKDDFKKYPVPKLKTEIQTSIAQKITDSHTSLEHSKKLLETAKKAVEMYIEQDEMVAEKFIQENLIK